MPEEQYAGGLTCTEVLALLGDYVDETATPSQRKAIETHLGACTWCTRFGGHYIGLVTLLRDHLANEALPAGEFAARVDAALDPTG